MGWSPLKGGEVQDKGRILGRPGAQGIPEWPRGGKAHHGRQRDALVPLRVSCLLQDLAAQLEDTEDRWMKLCGAYGLPRGPPHQPGAVLCHVDHPPSWAEEPGGLEGSDTGDCREKVQW